MAAPSRRLLVIGIASVLVAAAACGGDTSAQGGASSGSGSDVIRVGAVQPLTGPLATGGNFALQGQQLAVDIVNEEGGIDGKRVELSVVDAPTVQDAQTQVQTLVRQNGVKVVTGTYGSSLAVVSAQTARRHGGFYVETNSSSSDITRNSAPFSVKMPWTLQDVAATLPEFVQGHFATLVGKDPGQLRVALLHEDGDYGKGLSSLLPAALAKAGLPPLVADEAYTASTTQDFTPIIERLRAAKVDLLIGASYVNDTQLFLRQAVQQNLSIPAVVGISGGFADQSLVSKLPASLLSGVYVLDSNPTLDSGLTPAGEQIVKKFLAAFERKNPGKRPSSPEAFAFLSMYALLHYVLPGTDVNDPQALLDKAKSLDVPIGSLPMGYGIKIGAVDDPIHPHTNTRTLIVLNQWQDGSIVTVSPEKYAATPAVPWAPAL